MTKPMYGFKADEDFMEYLDKLISLSQYGMTDTNYKTRSDFIMTALVREAKHFQAEVSHVPMLAPLAKVLYETYIEGKEEEALFDEEAHKDGNTPDEPPSGGPGEATG